MFINLENKRIICTKIRTENDSDLKYISKSAVDQLMKSIIQ